MATLENLKTQVLRLLGDTMEAGPPVAGKQYEASLLTEGINAGIDAILPWVPEAKVADLVGDGSTVAFDLPASLYRIEAVWDGLSKIFLEEAQFAPMVDWANSSLSDTTWIEYPQGKITFSRGISSSDAKIYYAGVWDKLSADADVAEPPAITHYAICLFAAGYCLQPKGVAAANIRQYNTKVDSGTPFHNPMNDQTKFMLERFEVEMSRHPAHDKGIRQR